jgi:aspartyl-tRNA synthetase
LLDGSNPGAIKSKAYDLVCNGSELASGSIRIHHRELQEKVFRVLGYSKEEVDQRFRQILEAFEFGAPPMAASPRESTGWWPFSPGPGPSAT